MGYSYAIRQRGCQVCFSANSWADVVGDIAFRPYKIPYSLTAQRYRNFVPLSVRQVLWLQYDSAEAHCG